MSDTEQPNQDQVNNQQQQQQQVSNTPVVTGDTSQTTPNQAPEVSPNTEAAFEPDAAQPEVPAETPAEETEAQTAEASVGEQPEQESPQVAVEPETAETPAEENVPFSAEEEPAQAETPEEVPTVDRSGPPKEMTVPNPTPLQQSQKAQVQENAQSNPRLQGSLPIGSTPRVTGQSDQAFNNTTSRPPTDLMGEEITNAASSGVAARETGGRGSATH